MKVVQDRVQELYKIEVTVDFASAKIVTWKRLIKSDARYFWGYLPFYVCDNIYDLNHEASLVRLETGLRVFSLGSWWNWTVNFLLWPAFLTVNPLPSGGFSLDGLFQQPFALGVMWLLPNTEYQWSDYCVVSDSATPIESLGICAEKVVTSGFAAA